MMLKPRALEPGSRIAIVAPASPFRREEFDDGIAELRRIGFAPVYDESVFARLAYVAGPAAHRAEALHQALIDPTIAAILAVRGGFGSAQILPLLDCGEIRRARKPIIGYSDITSLLAFVSTKCEVVAFHGPTLAGRLGKGTGAYDRGSFLRALSRREPLGELTTAAVETMRKGEAVGPLFGGTLAQLTASLGTPFAFSPPERHVLFLEEVNERPYRLDRMVTQLRQAGILARAVAVVVGELPGCDEPGGDLRARSVMADLLTDFPGPVLIGFPSGHTAGPAMTLPLGVACRVIADDRPRLVIEEAAVE
jgi:muramoyltetrapeptide carboxypeptidase